jgi:hypothetical protein
MTPANSFKALGVVSVWDGNEEALTLANPAIDVDGRVVVTRGENWTSPDDVSETDVSDAAGFVATDPIDVFEGDVAWLAGPSYAGSYRTLVESGFSDLLEIASWQTLPGGWLIHYGSAAQFYETGAAVASLARQWSDEVLAAGRSAASEQVLAARVVDTGSPGVPRGDRRLADAVWYSMVGDFDLYSRAVHLAAAALDCPENEIKDLVEQRVHFYQARAQAKRRSLREIRMRKMLAQYRALHSKDQTTILELQELVQALSSEEAGLMALKGVKIKAVPLNGPSNMHGARTKNLKSYRVPPATKKAIVVIAKKPGGMHMIQALSGRGK